MIRNFLYVVTDGKLDDMARKSIIGCSNVYAAHNPIINIFCLNSKIPEEDEVFEMISKSAKIVQVSLTEDELRKVVPNLMDKKFKREEGKELSHWENAKEHNQHLAEFSDLAIFYMMKTRPKTSFLYMDSDILPILPLAGKNEFIVSYDKGADGNDYINSSYAYIPEGNEEAKSEWVEMLENELLEKYHFRYGLPGPVAFDKFFGTAGKLTLEQQRDLGKSFRVVVLPTKEFNILTYKEVYEASIKALNSKKPLVIDLDHVGPALNIPRSAITSAITHTGASGLTVLLGLVHDKIGAQLIPIEFEPKNVTGIEYYEKLKKNNN